MLTWGLELGVPGESTCRYVLRGLSKAPSFEKAVMTVPLPSLYIHP